MYALIFIENATPQMVFGPFLSKDQADHFYNALMDGHELADDVQVFGVELELPYDPKDLARAMIRDAQAIGSETQEAFFREALDLLAVQEEHDGT